MMVVAINSNGLEPHGPNAGKTRLDGADLLLDGNRRVCRDSLGG